MTTTTSLSTSAMPWRLGGLALLAGAFGALAWLMLSPMHQPEIPLEAAAHAATGAAAVTPPLDRQVTPAGGSMPHTDVPGARGLPGQEAQVAQLRAEVAALTAAIARLEAPVERDAYDEHHAPVMPVEDAHRDPEDEARDAIRFYDAQFSSASEVGGYDMNAADIAFAALVDAGIEELPAAIECTQSLCRMQFAEDMAPTDHILHALMSDDNNELQAVTIRSPDGNATTYIAQPGYALPELALE